MIANPFFPEIHGNFGFGCMRLPIRELLQKVAATFEN